MSWFAQATSYAVRLVMPAVRSEDAVNRWLNGGRYLRVRSCLRKLDHRHDPSLFSIDMIVFAAKGV